MTFLQAAIGYGILLTGLFGAVIFIGTPVLCYLFIRLFKKWFADEKWHNWIVLVSILISMPTIAMLLIFCLKNIDLTYS
jgi:hypothetical protein